ncbi:MAG: hypothetical protein WCJ81_03545 [bacterium]
MYVPTYFNTELLHALFTKQTYEPRERYCIIKYFLHAKEHHGSYHCVGPNDFRFLRACSLSNSRTTVKKLYTHYDLFTAIEEKNIPTDQTIVLYDKDWLFDSWKKRRHRPYDPYYLVEHLEALEYKYALLKKDTTAITTLLSKLLIFIAIRSSECNQLCIDANIDIIPIDDISHNTYFFKSTHIRQHIHEYREKTKAMYELEEAMVLERLF